MDVLLELVEPKIFWCYEKSRRGSFYEGGSARAALFGMGSTKYPGLDGFHALFFQRNREVDGNDLPEVCLGVLNGRNSVAPLNETHVVLIPKIKNPRRVSDY